MDKLIITSVNFKYEDGHDQKYTHVDIHFISSSAPFNLNGRVTATRGEYGTHGSTEDGLKNLALIKVVQEFGKEISK